MSKTLRNQSQSFFLHTTINSAEIAFKEQRLLIGSLPAAQTQRPLKSPHSYT